MSCPGEPGRFFEKKLDGLVGGEIWWMGIGGDSRLGVEDLDIVAGLFGVTLQSGYTRNVVKLGHLMDAPCYDDIRILII